jgi:hypothetical protein
VAAKQERLGKLQNEFHDQFPRFFSFFSGDRSVAAKRWKGLSPQHPSFFSSHQSIDLLFPSMVISDSQFLQPRLHSRVG